MFDFCLTKESMFDIIQINKQMFRTIIRTEVIMNNNIYTQRTIANRRRKAHREMMIRIKITVAATLVLLISMFLFNTLRTEATEQIPETTYKYFTYHEIEKGDTLHDLAKEYISYEFYDNLQEYIEEVKEINHMENDLIIAGNMLVLPYFSTEHK